jgi:hypothetical protein
LDWNNYPYTPKERGADKWKRLIVIYVTKKLNSQNINF